MENFWLVFNKKNEMRKKNVSSMKLGMRFFSDCWCVGCCVCVCEDKFDGMN